MQNIPTKGRSVGVTKNTLTDITILSPAIITASHPRRAVPYAARQRLLNPYPFIADDHDELNIDLETKFVRRCIDYSRNLSCKPCLPLTTTGNLFSLVSPDQAA